jgi:DNA polymerase-3 subunit beta
MEFSISAKSFKDILDAARHAVPSSPSVAVFAGVQITAENNAVLVTGSDGETTIQATTDQASVVKAGSAVLAPRPIMTFLSSLDPDAKVSVLLQDSEVVVSVDKLSPYKFRTLGTKLPTQLNLKGESRPVDFSKLQDAIVALRAAVNREHMGVQLISDDTQLSLYVTDYYRLHSATLAESSFGAFTGVVPLSVLERIAHHRPHSIVVDDKGRAIRCISDTATITARLLQVAFPDVAGALSRTPATRTDINVAAAKSALARLASVSDGAAVTVWGDTDGLHLDVANAEVGSGSELIAAAPSEIRFIVDRQYLLDALLSHHTETVSLGFSSQFEAVFFQSTTPFPTTSVVMPMRV